MTFKLEQLSTSLILPHQPLTKIALDNKIRAMISQFHPYERQFTFALHGNILNRIYTDNKSIISKHVLELKPPFPMSKSSIMMKNQIKFNDFLFINKQMDDYIYPYKKVIEWLEHFDYNC